MDWKQLQEEHKEWSLRNFGVCPLWQWQLGLIEEVGELAHAHLKSVQHIRGTTEEFYAKKIDAVADCMIFLAGYCTCKGWILDEEVRLALLTEGEESYLPEICISYAARHAGFVNPRALIKYLHRYCIAESIDFESATFEAWAVVKQRDYRCNSEVDRVTKATTGDAENGA